MYLIQASVLCHFVGIGLLFSSLFGGFVLQRQYRREESFASRLLLLKAIRSMGLLSPIAVTIVLLSGIGNMTLGPHHYTLFSDGWLSAKLALFAVLLATGSFLAILGSRRTEKAMKFLETNSEPQSVEALDRQIIVLYLVQFLLIVAILGLSIVRPNQ